MASIPPFTAYNQRWKTELVLGSRSQLLFITDSNTDQLIPKMIKIGRDTPGSLKPCWAIANNV